jgi:acetyl-CoA carboxylase biotin carboxyl carrier protein
VDLQEIRKIVELMNEHGLTHFDLTKKDFHLKLKKGADLDDLRSLLASLPAAPVAGIPAAPTTAAAPVASPTAAPPAAAPVPEGIDVTSPMVGTFYLRSAPDAPPLVNVGDPISVGQTLCIIEAMKVMNEIKAERGGILSAIMAEDGSPVQFGDVLFRLK